MAPGVGQKAVRTAGALFPAVAGMQKVPGRDVTRSPGQIGEFTGVGSASPAATVDSITATSDDLARLSSANAADGVEMPPRLPSPAGKRGMDASSAKTVARDLALKRGTGGKTGAGYKLDGLGNVVEDPVQKQALKAGVKEGAVSMINAATDMTKKRMKQMVGIVRGGIEDMEYKARNRPSHVIGDSLKNRIKIIHAANRKAGDQMDGIVKGLKGETVDYMPAVETFKKEMAGLDVDVNIETGRLNFDGSMMEGTSPKIKEVQSILQTVMDRLYRTKVPTAYDVHRAKRAIDTQVTFGATPDGGLKGNALRIVKGLRHDLDAALDTKFDDYKQVNDTYSETIRILKDMQDLSGKRIDIMSSSGNKAMALMSRKVLSNYKASVEMIDSLDDIDVVAQKHAPLMDIDTGPISDEIMKLIPYEAELRRLLPDAVQDNTIQGLMGAEAARMAGDVATGNKAGLVSKAMNMAGKIGGKSQDEIMLALERLLDSK